MIDDSLGWDVMSGNSKFRMYSVIISGLRMSTNYSFDVWPVESSNRDEQGSDTKLLRSSIIVSTRGCKYQNKTNSFTMFSLIHNKKVRKRWSYLCNRPWRQIELWEVEAPLFSRQSADRWRWDCQPYGPTALYPSTPEDSWYSFLLEAESNPGP
jgi:hypothetical protein